MRKNPVSFKKLSPVLPHLIILFAFWLQLRYLAELHNLFPDSFGQEPFCGVDAKAHLSRALGLLAGSEPGRFAYYFIPLYPFYLAGLKILFPDLPLLLPIYGQALLQLPGIAALYGLGRLVFSRRTGLWAALGLATYNYYLFYLPCFDQTLLTIPFLTLGLYFILKFYHQPKHSWLLSTGICLAIATLSRPTMLLLYPILLLWLSFNRQSPLPNPHSALRNPQSPIANPHSALRNPHSAIRNPQSPLTTLQSLAKQTLLLFLPFLILVAPITWHNYQVTDRFILISDNFEVNLFTGNNPDAYGLDSLAHVQSQPAVLRFEELYERVKAGETTLTQEVIRYITTQPGDWLALTLTKVWLWFGEGDERLVSPYFPLMVSQSATLRWLPVEWQAVAIVAALGIIFAPKRRWREVVLLWLVYGIVSVATILFFIQLRFRLPFAPFVLLMAASLLAAAPELRQQYPRRFWTSLSILLLLYPLRPTLWLFIGLLVGLGLWTKPPTFNNSSFALAGRLAARKGGFGRQSAPRAFQVLCGPNFQLGKLTIIITGLIGAYLVGVGWWLQANTPAAAQTIDHYLGPPLAGSGVLGQTFQVDCEGLSQIEITLGTFQEPAAAEVTFYLATDTSARTILFMETFAGESVEDYQKKKFSFPPLANSAGQPYFFFIASPASTPHQALTARGYTDTPLDRYPQGSAWAGQLGTLQRMEADFAFAAACTPP